MLAAIPRAGSKAAPAQLTAPYGTAPFWRGRGFVEQGLGGAMGHWCPHQLLPGPGSSIPRSVAHQKAFH